MIIKNHYFNNFKKKQNILPNICVSVCLFFRAMALNNFIKFSAGNIVNDLYSN